jgi:uncharacterized protein Yka (UPF0111/DUF47 family)
MSSGRIEIPMDEFKGMKEKIDSLEKTLASKDKEIEVLKDKVLNLENAVDDIADTPLFERVFNWKSNLKNILGYEHD